MISYGSIGSGGDDPCSFLVVGAVHPSSICMVYIVECIMYCSSIYYDIMWLHRATVEMDPRPLPCGGDGALSFWVCSVYCKEYNHPLQYDIVWCIIDCNSIHHDIMWLHRAILRIRPTPSTSPAAPQPKGGVLVLRVGLDFDMFLYCFWLCFWTKSGCFSSTATGSGLPGAKTTTFGL